MKRQANIWTALGVVLALSIGFAFVGSSATPARAASAGKIVGVVKDSAGKPLRGAIVTVRSGDKSISRYSDRSGRLEIADLKPGMYEVATTALGHELKAMRKEVAEGPVEVSVALAPTWGAEHMSTADFMSAIPDAQDRFALENTCTSGCHNVSWIMRRKGMTARQWSQFIPRMGTAFVIPRMRPAERDRIGAVLERHFGPHSTVPAHKDVQRPEFSDEALRATFRMYEPPTATLPHSVHIGSSGKVYFTEFDVFANALGEFDPATDTFKEYKVPTPRSGIHNPWVARDGKVWVTLSSVNKIAALDPATGTITEYQAPPGASSHTLREDAAGNIWYSGGGVTKFDPRTRQFTCYKVPMPTTLPAHVVEAQKAGAPPPANVGTYDLALDSRGNVWFTTSALGNIGKLDTKTGDMKLYPVPGATNMKGIEVDAQDNVWFSSFGDHKLGKFDQKTERMELYQAPTKRFSPYGIVFDKKGRLWTVDFAGSNVTRFDPRTQKFTEFPLPSPHMMPRFFAMDAQERIWFADFATGRIVSFESGESIALTQR